MSYATKAAVLDRFLADRNVDPGEVLGVSMDSEQSADIRVHLFSPIEGLDYTPWHGRHYTADVEREDVIIRVVYVGYLPQVVPA